MDNQDNDKNEEKSEYWQEFEERWEHAQEQKIAESKAKMKELDRQFPLEERNLHLSQIHAQKELERRQAELESSEDKDEPLVDVTQFKPVTSVDIVKVLGQTIKQDETNKLLTFLAELSAYTEDSQQNVSFNAPSSSGKSFIPTEIAKLFPEKDIIDVAYCSPTAFFHDYGEFDKELGGYRVDLSRKILIFLDQPHTLLLQHLRPLLSHDKKEIRLKITDKSQKAGLKTKNIYLIGYPVVIFCTAGLNLDEQEATRFLLLSPEINQEKIRQAVMERIKKESNQSEYRYELDQDPDRQLLKERIRAIKQEHIAEIKIKNPKLIELMFLDRVKMLKPRHQRDIYRIISLVKVLALLNLWFRERNGSIVIANDEDITEAFKIWDQISESQELNIPPYVYNLYKDVIQAAYRDKSGESDGVVKIGLTRQDISQKHYEVYGRFLPHWQLKEQIIPLLEASSLITQEQDMLDKRKTLIYPTALLSISPSPNNGESHGGVDDKSFEELNADEQLELCKSVFGEGTTWAEEKDNDNN